jgi:hypothetical protein
MIEMRVAAVEQRRGNMGELDDLEQFLREQQSTDEQKQDWDQRRQEFLTAAQGLLGNIQEWLQPLAGKGLVEFAAKAAEIDEWHIGRYKAPGLLAKVGGTEVQFVPVGAEVVGALGRVDVVGPKGRIPLLLRTVTTPAPGPSKETGPRLLWQVTTPPPKVRYIDLTRDTLAQAIRGVLGA